MDHARGLREHYNNLPEELRAENDQVVERITEMLTVKQNGLLEKLIPGTNTDERGKRDIRDHLRYVQTLNDFNTATAPGLVGNSIPDWPEPGKEPASFIQLALTELEFDPTKIELPVRPGPGGPTIAPEHLQSVDLTEGAYSALSGAIPELENILFSPQDSSYQVSCDKDKLRAACQPFLDKAQETLESYFPKGCTLGMMRVIKSYSLELDSFPGIYIPLKADDSGCVDGRRVSFGESVALTQPQVAINGMVLFLVLEPLAMAP